MKNGKRPVCPQISRFPSGNMSNDAIHTYAYDAENRLKSVDFTAATYSYDGNGLRVKKVAGATTTVYIFSGAKLLAEYVNGTLSKQYVYAGNQLLTTYTGTALSWQHADHLSTRFELSGGNVIRTAGHLPFGDLWYETGNASKWKFTSYERDAESGLDYAMARFDASRLGRFMSPDPIGGDASDPQSLNGYGYAANDPISLIDPLGLYTAGPPPPPDYGPLLDLIFMRGFGYRIPLPLRPPRRENGVKACVGRARAGGPLKPSFGLSGAVGLLDRAGQATVLVFLPSTHIQSPRVLRRPWRTGENCSTPSLPRARQLGPPLDLDFRQHQQPEGGGSPFAQQRPLPSPALVNPLCSEVRTAFLCKSSPGPQPVPTHYLSANQ